jgi:hypothetical protein
LCFAPTYRWPRCPNGCHGVTMHASFFWNLIRPQTIKNKKVIYGRISPKDFMMHACSSSLSIFWSYPSMAIQ